jgi:hypothetical protein
MMTRVPGPQRRFLGRSAARPICRSAAGQAELEIR